MIFYSGYYADIETRCQVWHWCLHSGTMFDFLCPNGTVFNQVRIKTMPVGIIKAGWHVRLTPTNHPLK